ncbi:MAG: pyridoxal phosphate-dependent aminotransferase [Lachnospiraceae bacterium]|nr:pyridoxal phosphate-dependent aminotransferase [Candidatus Equihabitans merdae]
MPTQLSSRLKSDKESATSVLVAKVAQLKKEGRDIISLNVGEPDFSTPTYIRQAAEKVVADEMITYTPGPGIMPLREAIAHKIKTENHINCTADNVIVTVGAKEALYCGLMALVEEGDEVIIPTPCYVSYPDMVKMAGGTPVYVPLDEHYNLDAAAVKKAITPKTKAIIICTPCNPTGSVFSENELAKLADLAVSKDFFILADEIYEKIIYAPAVHTSIASFSPEVAARTITINGFSKSQAMTGWRIGYAVAPVEIIKGMQTIKSQISTCVSAVSQKAALAALLGPQDDTHRMAEEFEKRMQYVYKRINAIPGFSTPAIQGAFYAFFDIKPYMGKTLRGRLIESDIDFCEYLLDEAGVACVPGTPYMHPGAIRISYATSMEVLEKAMDRIEEAVRL